MNMFMLIDPLWIIREWHRPYVQKGAVWLDEYYPNWVEKILPDELDLSSTDLCICGQMFGCYSNRPEAVNEAYEYGFNCDENLNELFQHWDDKLELTADETLQTMSYKALDLLWLDEVWWRFDLLRPEYGPPAPKTTTNTNSL